MKIGLVKGIILNVLAMFGTVFFTVMILMLGFGLETIKEYGAFVKVFVFIFSMVFVIWLGESYCDDREQDVNS